ncbi:MAG: hypothetical protein U1E05_09665 [Patescibacteria group bacterium]|nr:hypothetical protein [Patescibacteria group bacterium]
MREFNNEPPDSPREPTFPDCSDRQPNDWDAASEPPALGPLEEAAPEPSVSQLLLAPIGLFVLPVITAVLGAAWGNSVAEGELLGGLLGGLFGLAVGMGAAILVARILDWRKQTKANRNDRNRG